MLHYIDPTSAFALSREKKNYILRQLALFGYIHICSSGSLFVLLNASYKYPLSQSHS